MAFRLLMVLAALAASPLLPAASSDVSAHDRIRVQLISETDAIRPGEPFRLALKLEPDEHWHTYWKNPGDSGLKTRLEWDLSAGFSAAPVDWPWPERLPVEHLVNYGYSGVHALPVTITPPADLEPGLSHELTVSADWLVCRIECIPGSATLNLELPVTGQAPQPVAAHAGLFDWIDSRQPEPVDWPAQFTTGSDRFSLQVDVPADFATGHLAMFPADNELVDHAAAADFTARDGRLLASQALSDYFTEAPESVEIVLVDTAAGTAVSFDAVPGELVSTAPPPTGGTGNDAGPGLALALLLALGGGVLLNLMPCVFPVLSLKALNLVEGGGRPRAHAVVFTAGVLATFAVVAAVLLGLRAAGEAAGWGFQLQSPGFVGLLALLLFAMGLSLSGLIDFGTRWMGAGQKLTEQSGLSGSFFTGVLACVVASPCTAPFMGTALGFAVTQPTPVAMGIFVTLGFGLALPMLVLGFIPALARVLPRPGAWMETFKQAMAFPLYLTVAWLLWVLTRQTDANALAAMLTGMVVLAFALWLAGRRTRSGWGTALRHVTVGLSGVVVVAALAWAGRAGPDADTRSADTAWEPWSAERLAELRSTGKPVFVNMTADWCVTCLVNEQVALDTEAVRTHMEDRGIVYLKGDWTRRNPAITDYLSKFDRNGVPLYVYYPGDSDASPKVLPQVLTPGLVTGALQ